jgi:hypothetical protein
VKAKPKPKPKPKPGEGPTMTAAVNPSSWRRMHRSSENLDGRRRWIVERRRQICHEGSEVQTNLNRILIYSR